MNSRPDPRSRNTYTFASIIRFLLAMTLLAGFQLAAAPAAQAAGCYPDGYYSFLFKATPQQAEGGDPRMMALSDSLTATGEDPKDKPMGSGCMCGVNNGRWDQMLFNASARDAGRAPVTFRINLVRGDMFDKSQKPRGEPIIINPKRLPTCFGSAVKSDGYLGFDHPSGLTKAPNILEPGENMVGCLCLAEDLRTLSGTLKLKVNYTPLILVRQLNLSAKAGVHTASAEVKGLAKGQAHYFQITLPANGQPADLSISLAPGAKATLYALDQATGFKDAIKDWKAGPLTIKAPKPGASYWIMVRATADKANAALKVSYKSTGQPAPIAQSQGPALIEVGKAASRTYKVYLLGMGTPDRKTPSSFEAGPSKARPCCTGKE